MEACVDYLSLAVLFPVVQNLMWSNLLSKERAVEEGTGFSIPMLWSMSPRCHFSWYI